MKNGLKRPEDAELWGPHFGEVLSTVRAERQHVVAENIALCERHVLDPVRRCVAPLGAEHLALVRHYERLALRTKSPISRLAFEVGDVS